MKSKLSGIRTIGSIVAAAIVATMPLKVQANAPAGSASSKTAESAEITSLKHQIYMCHHHKRHHRAACPVVMEKQVVIEKPVIVEKEKIVEKQVFVDRPVMIEKPVVVETQTEQRVVVEHSKHRRHLLHFGIPFIGVSLF
jgi:hypothetical protein